MQVVTDRPGLKRQPGLFEGLAGRSGDAAHGLDVGQLADPAGELFEIRQRPRVRRSRGEEIKMNSGVMLLAGK